MHYDVPSGLKIKLQLMDCLHCNHNNYVVLLLDAICFQCTLVCRDMAVQRGERILIFASQKCLCDVVCFNLAPSNLSNM